MRRAFTLIEVLVVITIIAILISLLLPALSALRHRSRIVVTSHRMQDLERSVLATAAGPDGVAAVLQDRFDLGGVRRFAVLERVMNTIRPTTGYGNAAVYPPQPTHSTIRWSTDTRKRMLTLFFDPANDWWEKRKTRDFYKELYEVLPDEGDTVDASLWTSRWPALWPRTDWDQDVPGTAPPILRFPWGRPGLRRDGSLVDPSRPATDVIQGVVNAWVAGASLPGAPVDTCSWTMIDSIKSFGSGYTTLTNPFRSGVVPVYAQRSDGSPAYTALSDLANRAEPFDAGLLSPLRSTAFLAATGICPDADRYRSDRGRDKPWNDAWGRPLIVAYALFQPERYITDEPEAWKVETGREDHRFIARDRLLRRAREVYGYSRSVYLAIGASGPVADSDLTAAWDDGVWDAGRDAVVQRQVWRQIRRLCAAHEWNETTAGMPPWSGIRSRRSGSQIGLLSAPVEVR